VIKRAVDETRVAPVRRAPAPLATGPPAADKKKKFSVFMVSCVNYVLSVIYKNSVST
jgi:hypothetical protein